jgi:hypothetical protein
MGCEPAKVWQQRPRQIAHGFERPLQPAAGTSEDWGLLVSVPVRFRSIVVEDLIGPVGIHHVRPMLFVESRSILEYRLVDIENQVLLILVNSQSAPGQGEQLVAHTEESAEGQDGICHCICTQAFGLALW